MTQKGKDYPVRVLHVVGGMNRGGVETWLMHVLRNMDRDRFHFDFLVHTEKACAYDDEIRRLGSRVIPCLHPSRPWLYARNFMKVLRQCGPYDVIHSHVHHYSGYVLRLARTAGVPKRIAHSHNDTLAVDSSAGLLRKTYLRIMEKEIRAHATVGLAASEKAAVALYGPLWKKDPRWRVLYCGIDLQPFSETVDRRQVRSELGLPPDAFVVGHVGRFSPQKNHAFLMDIAAELVRREPRTRVLLVGDGPLRPAMEAKAARLGLQEHVLFLGLRSDVPRLIMGAMDVFLFPSFYEGLGLVLIEAQAAGLPCVLSDVVPREVDLLPTLIHRASLDENAAGWADLVFSAVGSKTVPLKDVLSVLSESSFNIIKSVENIQGLYGSR